MHISKVELENIKSHIDSKFEFSRGTTAITGRNGAGKTTIIEAIAWTLFDLLDYKKEDFVRRGAKKGVARVTFESGLDEREYVVYRDTATGYNVFDPQLGKRIADKREEVTRFLWQHLGLEPGTDLRALFKEAVGVPQGTLTAIFLGTPLERKSTFDRLLKVEEYRQAAEKLRETSRYLDNSITDIQVRIARAEGELARFELVEEEHSSVNDHLARLSHETEKLLTKTEAKAKTVADLDEQESKLTRLTAAVERARAEREKAQLICRQREADFRAASQAAEVVTAVREKAERHIALLGRMKELEHERQERDRLRAELGQIDTTLARVQSEQKQASDALEKALSAHAEVNTLKEKVAEQLRIESAADALKGRIGALRAIKNQIKSLDERLERLRNSYRNTVSRIKDVETSLPTAVDLDSLENRNSEIVGRLAELRASLEHDERFQTEIKNGLCPVLSEKCLNLKEGQTLHGFLKDQFAALRTEIAALDKEQSAVTAALSKAREAQVRAATIETLRAREAELAGEGKCIAEEKSQLETELTDLPKLEESLAVHERELAVLDNPKARVRMLETEAARDTELREKLSEIESNIERLNSDRNILLMRLENYKDLDVAWTETTAERDATADAHRTFLANETLALKLPDSEKLFETARLAAGEFGEMLDEAEREVETARQQYDRVRHIQDRVALRQLEQKLSETRATLASTTARHEQLSNELARLSELRESLKTEFAEKDRLSKIAETTTFIRETLREAAPRVARNYVHHVSVEACQMYREICGHADQTLSWSIDYGISLEEEGHERPFGNLSGGEQMAAALSVRLAILKQLSDIRIAFFDEPTTNMDAERRENLAQQISQIKNFDQLFVISHDDTFEGYVDNTLRVGN
jgi:DNA repair protein SbcC/Rad50